MYHGLVKAVGAAVDESMVRVTERRTRSVPGIGHRSLPGLGAGAGSTVLRPVRAPTEVAITE